MTNKVLKRPHRLKYFVGHRFNTLFVIATYYCRPPANRRLPRMLHRILTVSIPDPFSSRPNIKEEKVVWLARLESIVS